MALNYSSDPNKCNQSPNLEDTVSPMMSAVMFSAGAAGNIIALVLLDLRRRRRGSSLFQILLTALVVTDLLGTVSVSPIVLASYAWNRTLVSMSPGGEVCKYFGFSMTFFSLSTLSVLCAMAIERCVSIGSPYFYERHFNKKHCGHVALSLIYVTCFLFCVSPIAGYGSYVQYCPGTWCFLNMHPLSDRAAKVYTGFYASFTLIMISGTVGCNVSVIYCLVKMHRRHNAQRCRGRPQQQPGVRRRSSLSEEVEHLLLMSFITVAFILCSFPIVLRVYINLGRMEDQHKGDLHALRLLSLNSIINPWVFIILRPSVQRFIWNKLPCRRHKSKLPPGIALTVQSTVATSGPPAPLLNQAGDRG